MRNNIKTPIDLHAETVEVGITKIESNGVSAVKQEWVEALSAVKLSGDFRWLEFRSRLKNISDICISDIERLIDSSQESASKRKNDETEERIGVVDELINMVRSTGTLFMGQDGQPYLDIEKDNHRETHALNSSEMRELLSYRYFETHGRTAKAPQIQDALVTLAGFAKHEGETHDVALRVAKSPDGGYLLDCSNDKWQAIELTEEGYQIIDRSPVRFRRPKNSKPLLVPDRKGTLNDLRAIVNIAKEDLVLLVPTLLESLRVDTAFTVTEIVGDQGSAKSSTQETISKLLDKKMVDFEHGQEIQKTSTSLQKITIYCPTIICLI